MTASNEVVQGIWLDSPSPTRRSAITAVGREALAMLRQAVLLHRDVFETNPRERSYSGEVDCDVVVLLHGMFATAGVLRPLRERIEQTTGALTASFTYAPGSSIGTLAERLGELLTKIPNRARIHLVGHSLGGLVLRYYVQELMHDPRIVSTICLASPFAGSRHARLLPGISGRDILPGSELLMTLERGAAAMSHLPHLSIFAANDLMIEPGAWQREGDRVVIDAVGHNGLLYHPEAIEAVVRRIQSVIATRGRRRRPEELERFEEQREPAASELRASTAVAKFTPASGHRMSIAGLAAAGLSAGTPRVSSAP